MIRESFNSADHGWRGNASAALAVEALKQHRDRRLKRRWPLTFRSPRPPNLSQLLVGQHIINGLSVGVGVIVVALAASAIFGFAAGQPATLGAISASISDIPAPWREKARTMGFGFALAFASTAAIQLAIPWPLAALLDWRRSACGRRSCYWASAIGRSGRLCRRSLPMVFVLGFPRESVQAALRIEALLAAGGVAYIAFALLATVFTDASARRLVAGDCFPGVRQLSAGSRRHLRSRSRSRGCLRRSDATTGGARGTIAVGARFTARSTSRKRGALAPRSHDRRPARRVRCAGAAQCDVALIRDTPTAGTLLARVGDALRVGALDLEHLSLEFAENGEAEAAPRPPARDRRPQARGTALEADDATNPKTRAALDAATRRLILALGHIRRLEMTLSVRRRRRGP